MSERMWYYVKENKQKGPILQSTMQEMFDRGVLEAETLIWSESLSEWTPASKVGDFRVRISPSPLPLPKLDPPPMPSSGTLAEIKRTDVAQVRPWVRYWARMLDIYSFTLLAGFVLGLIFPALNMLEIAFGMSLYSIFIWIFVESSLLSTWGTTPGKWLFKTSLRTNAGEKLSFSNALSRSFSVWWRGLGIGFPIASLITLLVAHRKLTIEGVTTWDRKGGFVVSHKKIGAIRVVIVTIFFISFILLIALGETLGKSGW